MTGYCVVIKVYNEFQMLEGCITSLSEQTVLPKRVLIVDDGSPNPQVSNVIKQLVSDFPNINIELLRLPLKSEPNLDTVFISAQVENPNSHQISSKIYFENLNNGSVDSISLSYSSGEKIGEVWTGEWITPNEETFYKLNTFFIACGTNCTTFLPMVLGIYPLRTCVKVLHQERSSRSLTRNFIFMV